MKDQERKLRNLGLALEHIYGSRTNDDYRDFVEDWEMGYYDSEYFSNETVCSSEKVAAMFRQDMPHSISSLHMFCPSDVPEKEHLMKYIYKRRTWGPAKCTEGRSNRHDR